MFLQQGDVLIKSASKMPEGNKVSRKDRGYIIADGEVTGHAHVITDDVCIVEHDGNLFMKNEKPTTIIHEEHGVIEIPAGIWEFGRVNEYDHFAEEARKVVD